VPIAAYESCSADEPLLGVEPADNDTPENAYLRAWVRQTVALALQQLAKEERAKGRSEQFELLRDSLEGQELDRSYAEIAAQLGSTEAAIKVASHRLRRRFRAALLSQLGATVDDAADAEAELRELFHALGGV
jgi:RNA polymerase sigma-70 factor (ECF subfamily)